MGKKVRIFFASDLHGSEKCFAKLLNVPRIYKANVIIVGGDVSGKMIIPIIEVGGGEYRARFLGEEIVVRGRSGLEKLVDKIRAVGYYPYVTDRRGLEELESSDRKLEEIFEELIVESIRRWIKLADEKMRGLNVKFFMMPGNDDPYIVEDLLKESELIVNPDRGVVMVDEYHEMLSLGVSNITPWNCPRDLPEEEIGKLIDSIASSLERPEKAIFNIHVPPYGTNIDLAPKLDENLKPILTPGGEYELVHVGSIAVRKAIERYGPMLGLHGHIHEARGIYRLKKSLCVNPGSEYTEGILRGALIDIDNKGVRDYLLIQG